MITITESAKLKIADILAEENNPTLRIRAFVQGGGCSGMQYGFTLDEITNEDDFEVDGIFLVTVLRPFLFSYIIFIVFEKIVKISFGCFVPIFEL